MVLVSKNQFGFVRKAGFKCVEHYIRTAQGRKYVISDYDYVMMEKFIENRFKITKYA